MSFLEEIDQNFVKKSLEDSWDLFVGKVTPSPYNLVYCYGPHVFYH